MRTIPSIARPSAPRRMPSAVSARAAALAALALAAPPLAACGGAGAQPSGRIVVVAAESFWGSIAAQLGGDRVQVVSIVDKPEIDPHDYEPTPRDARAVAQARYVIVNGAGYDPWAARLVDAASAPDRTVLDVADLAGRRNGDNPHMWYAPAIVEKVVDRISADLSRIDAAGAAALARRRQAFLGDALAGYDRLRAEIRQRFAGTPVGATESIVTDLTEDLGLDLRTPPGYMTAISEGIDPPTGDKTAVDEQIAARSIKVLIFNAQNATTDIQGLVDRARSLGIEVVAVTETPEPGVSTFQDWQAMQLEALEGALARATGG